MNLDVVMAVAKALDDAYECSKEDTVGSSEFSLLKLCKRCADILGQEVGRERAALEREATCLR